jgi:hypothetical protein
MISWLTHRNPIKRINISLDFFAINYHAIYITNGTAQPTQIAGNCQSLSDTETSATSVVSCAAVGAGDSLYTFA